MHARGRGKIRAPRRTLVNPGENADFDAMWAVLASSLKEIYSKNQSKLSFEILYRNAYKMVLGGRGSELWNNTQRLIQKWLRMEVLVKVRDSLSASVLASLGCFGDMTTRERQAGGERFLKALKAAWEDYMLCMNMTSDVLMYMNSVYCSDHNLPNIFVTTMGLFRDHLLRSPVEPERENSPTVVSLLNTVVLDQIEMAREGDEIDKNLIRSCMYMLEGLYENSKEEESSKLYLTIFEPEYLEASRTYFRKEAENLLRQSDAPSYLNKTLKHLQDEVDRCRSTVSPLSTNKIKIVIDEELIKKPLTEVALTEGSGIKSMLENDRVDELRIFYDLNKRIDPKKTVLDLEVQKRIVAQGMEINSIALSSTTASAAAPARDGAKADEDAGPKVGAQSAATLQTAAAVRWVDDVLQLKDKYDDIWTKAFNKDKGLQAGFTRSFSEFINNSSLDRCEEYISLFIDENLKRGLKGKTESEVDAVLEKAIVLLRYVQNKDIFERYYKKHLSRRLLMGRSVSEDVERQMISRMKMEVGNHFTVKMEGMFKDMTVSEELSRGYKKHVLEHVDGNNASSKRIDLGVNILTNGFWPLEALGHASTEERENGGKGSCIFPPQIDRMKKGFQQYYLNKHSGRKLTWLASMGSADIRAVFPPVAGKEGSLAKERRHELNVSTYAMVVLLLFNDVPAGGSLTFEEIQARTLIPPNELIRNLQALAVAPKSRILVKEPMSKDVKQEDCFSFNDKFASKFMKIKVGVVAGSGGGANKVEGDREREATQRKNDEMRGGIIEAAVVRIMKQRKELAHDMLMAEVISQISSRFKPDVVMMKKRIESLIEREYLERIEGAKRPAYRYLA